MQPILTSRDEHLWLCQTQVCKYAIPIDESMQVCAAFLGDNWEPPDCDTEEVKECQVCVGECQMSDGQSENCEQCESQCLPLYGCLGFVSEDDKTVVKASAVITSSVDLTTEDAKAALKRSVAAAAGVDATAVTSLTVTKQQARIRARQLDGHEAAYDVAYEIELLSAAAPDLVASLEDATTSVFSDDRSL